jgi:serine/threonine protein kinase
MSTVEVDFLKVALRSGLLDAASADHLATEVQRMGVAPSRAALDAGYLTMEQVDVVESLARPRDLVPGYELESLLGQGGMGVVYRARQLAFDRVVALKMVRMGPTNPSMLARFEQEAKTIGRFAHPHIVTAFDFGRHGGRLYLAMEFLDGQDAERYVMTQHPLAERVVWQLIRQAAAGLSYAADLNVIHRDIKPANLLLVDPPKGYAHPAGVPFVKIADFGLAFLHESVDDKTRLTQENAAVGSPQYMAPEQLSGAVVDHRADIYALGATAYHLLAGQPPFHGMSLAQTFAVKLNGEPRHLAELRPDLTHASVDCVKAMMAIDPARRPTDYAALLARIDDLVGTESRPGLVAAAVPSVPRSVSVSPALRTFPRPSLTRRRLWLLLGGMVTAGCLLPIAVYLPALWRSKAGARDWGPSGWSRLGFDGRSLDGWRTISGQWTPGATDGEGGLVLAGRGGLGFPLTKLAEGTVVALRGVRLTMLVSLHQAERIDIQFAPTPEAPQDGRDVETLRIQAGEASWGTVSGDGRSWTPTARYPTPTITRENLHELRIERQDREWLIWLDGELLHASPASRYVPTEFRLVAESASPDQTARFSDILLEELVPPRTAAP